MSRYLENTQVRLLHLAQRRFSNRLFRRRNGRKHICRVFLVWGIYEIKEYLRDYRGLKKQITKIRESQLESPSGRSGSNHGSNVNSTGLTPSSNAVIPNREASRSQPQLSPPSGRTNTSGARYGSMGHTPPLNTELNTSTPSALFLPPPIQPIVEETGPGESSATRRLSRSVSDSAVSNAERSIGGSDFLTLSRSRHFQNTPINQSSWGVYQVSRIRTIRLKVHELLESFPPSVEELDENHVSPYSDWR